MKKIKFSKIGVANFFLYLSLALLLVLVFTDIKSIVYVIAITACIGIIFKWVEEWEKYSKAKKELGV